MTKTTWASDSNARGFPAGTLVTQFNYSDPSLIGAYQLNIARLPNGKTRYDHEWGKLGTDIQADQKAQILRLLNEANAVVAKACNLSFAGSEPIEGPG